MFGFVFSSGFSTVHTELVNSIDSLGSGSLAASYPDFIPGSDLELADSYDDSEGTYLYYVNEHGTADAYVTIAPMSQSEWQDAMNVAQSDYGAEKTSSQGLEYYYTCETEYYYGASLGTICEISFYQNGNMYYISAYEEYGDSTSTLELAVEVGKGVAGGGGALSCCSLGLILMGSAFAGASRFF